MVAYNYREQTFDLRMVQKGVLEVQMLSLPGNAGYAGVSVINPQADTRFTYDVTEQPPSVPGGGIDRLGEFDSIQEAIDCVCAELLMQARNRAAMEKADRSMREFMWNLP